MLRVCVQVLGEKAEKFTMFGDHGTVESYDSSDVTQRHQHTNRQSLCSTKPRINPALTSEQGSVTKGKRIQADRKRNPAFPVETQSLQHDASGERSQNPE
ncbi:hypothetical protein Y1Q_0022932 [Alligator mississippiensis]|uniref:Uncharacterized protein n=1 Tax=Alligator mississippiensis TaxID=8496 RepID=A0A151MHW7_ALLMI|nr:hypothetical protein Y1Q_0022932 [Alligator mississippiensis]